MTWALDLDGVVWLAGRGIPGSAEAVGQLRDAGERVVFLTNNSGPTVAAHVAALARVGVWCTEADVLTSAQAAASLVASGTPVAVMGDKGIREALLARGADLVGMQDRPAAVVVGRSVDFDYWALAAVSSALRGGARFIAANADATFPVGPARGGGASVATAQGADGGFEPPDGLLPGAGAVVAYLATASGRGPEVAGKPHDAMAGLVRQRVGEVAVVAGDRPDTDGLFARKLGARFGLVLSGVTRPSDLPVQPVPDLLGDDLLALVRQYLGAEEGAIGPAAPERWGQPVGPRAGEPPEASGGGVPHGAATM